MRRAKRAAAKPRRAGVKARKAPVVKKKKTTVKPKLSFRTSGFPDCCGLNIIHSFGSYGNKREYNPRIRGATLAVTAPFQKEEENFLKQNGFVIVRKFMGTHNTYLTLWIQGKYIKI